MIFNTIMIFNIYLPRFSAISDDLILWKNKIKRLQFDLDAMKSRNIDGWEDLQDPGKREVRRLSQAWGREDDEQQAALIDKSTRGASTQLSLENGEQQTGDGSHMEPKTVVGLMPWLE